MLKSHQAIFVVLTVRAKRHRLLSPRWKHLQLLQRLSFATNQRTTERVCGTTVATTQHSIGATGCPANVVPMELSTHLKQTNSKSQEKGDQRIDQRIGQWRFKGIRCAERVESRPERHQMESVASSSPQGSGGREREYKRHLLKNANSGWGVSVWSITNLRGVAVQDRVHSAGGRIAEANPLVALNCRGGCLMRRSTQS